MDTLRRFLYILPFMLLVISSFSGCGGGQGSGRTDPGTITVSADCSTCHDKDIAGTHFDLNTTGPIEGYVLDNTISWAPEGMGYVTKQNEKACSASCHDYHNGNMSINKKWYKSGHADVNSEPFSSTHLSAPCLRCHSGIGYASYVDSSNTAYPGWVPPKTELYPHHITCNACHDAMGFPTVENKRLRQMGSVTFTSGSSATSVRDATIDAGSSASCFTCHQGMESGWSLYKTMKSKGVDPYNDIDETITEQSVVSPHYLVAGAMLFSLKGFEFKGKTYTNGNIFHQLSNCTGCHMADSSDEDLGGHTFDVKLGDKMNIAACQNCHPGLTDFETIRLYDRDIDGDGAVETIKDEIEGLKTLIASELAKAGVYYNPNVYPYFFKVPAPQTSANKVTTWKESQLEAAFNLLFVEEDPGTYAHNVKYAVQLLMDSYEALGGTPSGVRPSSSDDRPAAVYTP